MAANLMLSSKSFLAWMILESTPFDFTNSLFDFRKKTSLIIGNFGLPKLKSF